MRAVFADTGYWIALLNPRDALHSRALAISSVVEGRPVITSQMVLAEILNFFASLGPSLRFRAAQVAQTLADSEDVEIVPQTAEQFAAALALYRDRVDKDWSLVDCSSFLVMRERGIREALAYDEHFGQAGFTPLLRED